MTPETERLRKRMEMRLAVDACSSLITEIRDALDAHNDEAAAVLAQRLAVYAGVAERASLGEVPQP